MKNRYISGEYLRQNPGYHVEDSHWKAQQILKMLNRHALRPLSVGEIGCGAGEILRQLQLNFPAEVEFHGFEISPQALELCHQRAGKNLNFYGEDLLDRTTAYFDLLLCIDVFEHVEDYLGFLQKLRDKAKYKIFHIPLDLSVQSLLRRTPILTQRNQAGHLHYFIKDTALATLRDSGYEILDSFYTPGSLDRATTLNSRLLKIPRLLFSKISPDFASLVLGGFSLLVLAK